MFVPGWEYVGGLLEFKWFFKTPLLVTEWSVSPLEMILALDVLHWKLNHLLGCCAAQPGVVLPHSSLPCWHVSCNSSLLLRYFKSFGFFALRFVTAYIQSHAEILQNQTQLRLSSVLEQMEMAVGFHEGWLSLSWL